MFGVLAIFGDLGCSVGPWLTGFISDSMQTLPVMAQLTVSSGLDPEQIGLKAGILLGIIFPVLMILGISALRKHK